MELRKFKFEMTLPTHINGVVLAAWSCCVNLIRCEVVMTLMQGLWCLVEALTVAWFMVKTTVDKWRRW
jgi:hypothetical protein